MRYAYLWRTEFLRGREEGVKDRPCALLLALADEWVVVLPITHRPPSDPAHGVEIPAATKRRLGLDDERSWIIVSKANCFVRPGPDLRTKSQAIRRASRSASSRVRCSRRCERSGSLFMPRGEAS